MGRIQVLPDEVIKKIAAGEVIERPASVVKELVENAVDARASRIAVAIEDGGKQVIRVVDDGEGMSAEDLRLAVIPHATSKISSDEDLFAVGTMGFRGEALASIGSVSRLRIRSRPPDSTEGHEIVVAAEKVELAQAAGCPVGTSVEVRDLFFNVPARRKFLRGRSTEAAHVNEQFSRIALAHPRIALELTHNGRVTHRWPGHESLRERVGRFCGRELEQDLIAIEWEERGLRLFGYVGPPGRSRSAPNWQYVFLNGRYIRDRFILHAIREAYRGLMEPNRHPVIFLYASIDPAAVDVNVHPTKIEVRWQDSNLVHSQVLAALREKFQRSDLTPAVGPTVGGRPARRPDPGSAFESHAAQPHLPRIDPAEQDRVRHEAAQFYRGATPITGTDPAHHGPPARGTAPAGPADIARSADFWRSLNQDVPPGRLPEPGAGPPHPPAAERPPSTTRPRAIQLHNAYLVAETPDGMIIVDQHALHERIMYDRLRQRIAVGVLESQRLLLPDTVQITPEQLAILDRHADLLDRLGLELTPFGRHAVAVNAVPAVIRDTDVAQFVRDLLDRLSEAGSQPNTEVVLEEMLAMMACKAAVKFGDPLTGAEIESLLAQREAVEKSTACPHGRPTALRFTLAELEKQFKRA